MTRVIPHPDHQYPNPLTQRRAVLNNNTGHTSAAPAPLALLSLSLSLPLQHLYCGLGVCVRCCVHHLKCARVQVDPRCAASLALFFCSRRLCCNTLQKTYLSYFDLASSSGTRSSSTSHFCGYFRIDVFPIIISTVLTKRSHTLSWTYGTPCLMQRSRKSGAAF